MYLAWREMLFARSRFLLMGLVLGLMSILIVIISGLTSGLVNDGVSGLKAFDADVVAFEEGTQTDSAFTRSQINLADADALAADGAVSEAAPLGLTIANAKNQDGVPVDLTLIGVLPDSFLAPEGLPEMAAPESRKADEATSTPHEVILSNSFEDDGMKVGDTITLERLNTEFTVTGFTDEQRTFGHVGLAYTPMDVWQEVHAGARNGEAARPEAYDVASVVVARTVDKPEVEALSENSGLDVRTLKESFNSSPGYSAETLTLTMIQWFLYIIAALVTGAFFLVWTIQRAGDIAVMRAMGATRGFLMKDSLGQAIVILVVSIFLGVAVATAMGFGLEQSPMPYLMELWPVVTGAITLFIAGLIGALVAVFRVTRTDPLNALGENR
ncbi:ABC transporter permease [Corynebacterium sp. H113]|uniref:ABC transporter permease n=1 Tax=Corynebacterium sp. H113 TaxID=3133419 RepID=UPI00309D7979